MIVSGGRPWLCDTGCGWWDAMVVWVVGGYGCVGGPAAVLGTSVLPRLNNTKKHIWNWHKREVLFCKYKLTGINGTLLSMFLMQCC